MVAGTMGSDTIAGHMADFLLFRLLVKDADFTVRGNGYTR